MNFKHIASTALVATGLLLLGGCAKNPDTEANAAAKLHDWVGDFDDHLLDLFFEKKDE